MSIIGAVIVPHPPLIIPTVGRGREREVQATIDAYQTAAKQAAAWEPEVLIITSPHPVMYADYFHISPGRGTTGNMCPPLVRPRLSWSWNIIAHCGTRSSA